MLKKAEAQNVIHGVRVYRGAPTVSHLLFANDSFLFFKAMEDERRALKDLLKIYEIDFGQSINFQKSGIAFSSNVDNASRNNLMMTLEVYNPLNTRRYLGLSSLIGRSK